MSTYIKKFEDHSQYETYIEGSEAIFPNVSYCEDDNEVHYTPFAPQPPYVDYSTHYLTTTALADGTFSFSGSGISYSLDDGETWTSLAANANTPTITAGNDVLWKGNMTPQMYVGIGTFSSSSRYDVKGNIMSLLYGDDFVGETTITSSAFYSLFYNNTYLVNAENLVLPATTLGEFTYANMFQGCTSLVTAPELLPATTLIAYCYQSMFEGCTSLVTAPELSATTLSTNGYDYSNMFKGCTSLVTAPELPATRLVSGCYSGMFQGCTSLNSIKCLATNISASDCITNWVDNVAASGTFTKAASMSSWTTGANGIPSGWTVQDA